MAINKPITNQKNKKIMKLKDLSKVIGIMIVLLTAMFWGCSQEDEFEYETEIHNDSNNWNKRAVKKSLASSILIYRENYYGIEAVYTFPTRPYLTEKASYDVRIEVYQDSTTKQYDHTATFINTPYNANLTNENVMIFTGPKWYYIELVFTATTKYSNIDVSCSNTYVLPHSEEDEKW